MQTPQAMPRQLIVQHLANQGMGKGVAVLPAHSPLLQQSCRQRRV
jgi:hypothetical protein